MKLIADSGSTKTDWVVVEDGKVFGKFRTQGINPFHQNQSAIEIVLHEELFPQLSLSDERNQSSVDLFFYGSGLRDELKPKIRQIFEETFALSMSAFASCVFHFENDLLGAARSLCGREEGIACILGTGANSCLFDGEKIIQNTPPLGYVIGDEGSGAVLGKIFLNAIFKDARFAALREAYLQESGLTMATIINKVYREPLANRFLASISPFIHQHLDVAPLRQLVIGNFRTFFQRNVVPYQRYDLPVHAVGSVAYYYQTELREAANLEGFEVGRILRSPMEGLILFHQSV